MERSENGGRMGKLCFLLWAICFSLWGKCDVQAASSYVNAKEFFESTKNPSHVEIYNGDIYHATSGRLAAPGSSLRYYTVGHDITVSGNGASVSFALKRGGSMQEISDVKSGGYDYELYRISCQRLVELVSARNPSSANVIFQADVIEVRMDCILTTKSGSALNGGVSETGNGGLNEWGVIYHLRDAGDLRAARRVFSGHDFATCINIVEQIRNYTLTVQYDAAGGTASNGYQTVPDPSGASMLYYGGRPVETRMRLFQQNTMINPNSVALSGSPSLTKLGYHLAPGKEWIYGNRYFSAAQSYLPKEIDSQAGLKDIRIVMSAGWQPNTYTLVYDANGGSGAISQEVRHIGQSFTVGGGIAKDDCSLNGYYVVRRTDNAVYCGSKGWQSVTGSVGSDPGNWHLYQPGENYVLNDGWINTSLPASDDTFTFVAGWEAMHTIAYDGNQALSGHQEGGVIRAGEEFAVKPYSVYQRPGYEAKGYYVTRDVLGFKEVSTGGGWKLLPTAREAEWRIYQPGQVCALDQNWIHSGYPQLPAIYTLHVKWEKEAYVIQTNDMGGSGGTPEFYARYGRFCSDRAGVLPIGQIRVPQRVGYEFQGYAVGTEGRGDRMTDSGGRLIQDGSYVTDHMTVFAFWKAKSFTITFDKQGGSGGSDSVRVSYDSIVPMAQAPGRVGYTFRGYYTQPQGKGAMYYDGHMNSNVIYRELRDITLYAHWVDDTPPMMYGNDAPDALSLLKFTSSPARVEVAIPNLDRWVTDWVSGKGNVLDASAQDLGSGLSAMYIYLGSDRMAAKTGLGGTTAVTRLNYVNTREGQTIYRAEAFDVSGNRTERHLTVKYDSQAPVGQNGQITAEGYLIQGTIEVRDYNIP